MQLLENFLQILIAGLCIGCLYGLMCMGLSMIFGVMRIINFAQGEFLMLGMYATFYASSIMALQAIFGPFTPFVCAVVISPILFLVGSAIYQLLLSDASERRGLGEDVRHSAQLIITLGVSLVIQNAGLIAFGTIPKVAKTTLAAEAWVVSFLNEGVMLFINQARVWAALLAVVIAAAVVIVMNKTVLGRSVRAAADDPDAARYCGVPVRVVYSITFGLGAAMTAASGGLLSAYFPFQPYIGSEFVIFMYAGVVLGGMGTTVGAFLGGLVIGLVQQMSTLVLPQQLQNATIFVVFLLVLLFRPNGLFGRNVERA